jgi:hypothetical protein
MPLRASRFVEAPGIRDCASEWARPRRSVGATSGAPRVGSGGRGSHRGSGGVGAAPDPDDPGTVEDRAWVIGRHGNGIGSIAIGPLRQAPDLGFVGLARRVALHDADDSSAKRGRFEATSTILASVEGLAHAGVCRRFMVYMDIRRSVACRSGRQVAGLRESAIAPASGAIQTALPIVPKQGLRKSVAPRPGPYPRPSRPGFGRREDDGNKYRHHSSQPLA